MAQLFLILKVSRNILPEWKKQEREIIERSVKCLTFSVFSLRVQVFLSSILKGWLYSISLQISGERSIQRQVIVKSEHPLFLIENYGYVQVIGTTVARICILLKSMNVHSL